MVRDSAGLWQESQIKELPQKVPAVGSRDHRATPCGLLFNEIVKSPDASLGARTSYDFDTSLAHLEHRQ